MGGTGYLCHTRVEVRRQLAGVGSPLLPCGSLRPNSGVAAGAFTYLNCLSGLQGAVLKGDVGGEKDSPILSLLTLMCLCAQFLDSTCLGFWSDQLFWSPLPGDAALAFVGGL